MRLREPLRGYQFLLDGVVRDPSVFEHNQLFDCLRGICSLLSLGEVRGPGAWYFPVGYSSTHPKTGGVEPHITGLVTTPASHLVVHAYPTVGFFRLDVFSVSPFEYPPLTDFVVDRLGATRTSRCVITRHDAYTPVTVMLRDSLLSMPPKF